MKPQLILFFSLLSFLFPGCKNKRTPPKNLESWLEQEYPGKYKVLQTWPVNPVRNMGFKVKESVIADIAQPLIQGVIVWDKREEGLNLTNEQIETVMQEAETNFHAAEQLHQSIQSSIPGACAAIYYTTAYIFPVGEPTLDDLARNRTLAEETILAQLPAHVETFLITYRDQVDAEYPAILPAVYWEEPGDVRHKHETFSLLYKKEEDKWIADEAGWQFNTSSHSFDSLYSKGRTEAEAWAKKQIGPEARLLELSEFEQVSQLPPRFVFTFPYSTEPAGENDEGTSVHDLEKIPAVLCEADVMTMEITKMRTHP